MSRSTNGRKARADLEFVQEALSLPPLSSVSAPGQRVVAGRTHRDAVVATNLHPCAGAVTPCPPGLREGELTWGEEGALV